MFYHPGDYTGEAEKPITFVQFILVLLCMYAVLFGTYGILKLIGLLVRSVT